MSDKPKTPEEALAEIRAAAEAGRIDFAPDVLTAQYNDEIQRIFIALYTEWNGKPPKRGIWTADGQTVGVLFEWDPETKEYSARSHATCKKVGEQLGIELTPRSVWEEAAATLRAKEGKRPVS